MTPVARTMLPGSVRLLVFSSEGTETVPPRVVLTSQDCGIGACGTLRHGEVANAMNDGFNITKWKQYVGGVLGP